MARDEPLLRIRVPDELKARLEAAKDTNRRSLNAEIRMRLEWSFDAGFDGGQSAPAVDQASELETLRAQVRALESRIPFNLVEQLNRVDALLNQLEGKVVVAVEEGD